MSRHRRNGRDRYSGREQGSRVWLWRSLAAVVLVVLGAAIWMAWTGLRARDELTAARSDITRLRAALVAGDHAGATQVLADAQAHAANARSLTSDPVWRLAAWVPMLGRTPAAISQATSVVDQAAASVLPPLVDAADQLTPGEVMHGDSLDLAAVAAALPSVQRARLALDPLTARLGDIRLGGVPAPVVSGVTSLDRQLGGLASDLTAVATAAQVIPSMLGQDGPRSYLVVFQNDAEARGTGGLVGAYAVVRASGGRLSVTALGTDADLRSATSPVLDLGPDYLNEYVPKVSGIGSEDVLKAVAKDFPIDLATIVVAGDPVEIKKSLESVKLNKRLRTVLPKQLL